MAMILRIIFYAFLFYLAYKLVFDFIIPVFKTTRRIKKGFREMQDRMQQPADPYHRQNGKQQDAVKNEKSPAGDYIDFEEIK